MAHWCYTTLTFLQFPSDQCRRLEANARITMTSMVQGRLDLQLHPFADVEEPSDLGAVTTWSQHPSSVGPSSQASRYEHRWLHPSQHFPLPAPGLATVPSPRRAHLDRIQLKGGARKRPKRLFSSQFPDFSRLRGRWCGLFEIPFRRTHASTCAFGSLNGA